MKKRFVHICEELEYTWLGKDNGMVPVYTHKILGYKSEIVTCNLKEDLPDNFRGIKIIKISRWFKNIKNFFPWVMFFKRIPLYYYILKNGKKIDVLMLFHITKCSYWNAFFYKKINPTGKIYVKADFNLDIYNNEIRKTKMKITNLREFFRKRREIKEYRKRKKLVKIIDILSYETKEAYEAMKNKYAEVTVKGDIYHIPNGYDDLFIENNFQVKPFQEKENIFLTVGRLGTQQKNTELLLNILEKIDLKNWKFYFIGSIESSFQEKIDNFYNKNPEKKENVIFTGVITDKKILYSYYNRAKVFLLSSRWEGFALVFLEALSFDNYILSTDVGGAQDVIENNKNGNILSNENQMKEKIENIINNKVDITIRSNSKNYFKWSNLIKKIKL